MARRWGVMLMVVILIIAVVFVEGFLLVEDATLFGALLLHELVVHRPLLPCHLLLLLPIQPQNQSFRLRWWRCRCRCRCLGILKGDGGRHAPARYRLCSAAAAHASMISSQSQIAQSLNRSIAWRLSRLPRYQVLNIRPCDRRLSFTLFIYLLFFIINVFRDYY